MMAYCPGCQITWGVSHPSPSFCPSCQGRQDYMDLREQAFGAAHRNPPRIVVESFRKRRGSISATLKLASEEPPA